MNMALFKPIVAWTFVLGVSSAQAEELVTIETRDLIEQSLILIKPDSPKAAVVLIPGGWGNLALGSFLGKPVVGQSGYANQHYLVNRRDDYADRGISVALVDAPSDMQPKGMSYGYRLSGGHAADLTAVVAYLKKQADVPVWLVGDSAAAFSLINAASNVPGVHGLVFASSVTRLSAGKSFAFANQYPDGVLDVDGWDKIDIPVLIVSNRQDQCAISPPADAEKLAAKLRGADKVAVKYFDQSASGNDPCICSSAHCFSGIQKDVNAAIADFILAH